MKRLDLVKFLCDEPLFACDLYDVCLVRTGVAIYSKDGFFSSLVFKFLNTHSFEYCLDCKERYLLIYCTND